MLESQIKEFSNVNPGAVSFLMELLKPENCIYKNEILLKLGEAKTIRGTNLYVLWSDLCKKEMKNVYSLCENCPTDILEDACNRQDYSGFKLIEKYLP
jgi:hypothetical protein